MLYLVKSNGYYKIGYTANIKQRMDGYRCDNPCYKFIGVRDGDRKDENVLHLKYSQYCVIGEWMKLPKDILKELKNLFNEKIDKPRFLSDFKRVELLNKGLNSEEIDFLGICLDCSDDPTVECRFNMFYDNKKLNDMLSNYLNYKERDKKEMIERLREKFIIIKYDGGYMINPNYLYRGDYIIKKELFISYALFISFDQSDHQVGVVFNPVELG